jgi:uncharacterized cupredoxin-like copper-binding protein
MADETSDPAAPARPATPRWVKLFGLGALGFVLVVAGVMLLSGGAHGPGMHTPSGGRASPSAGTASGTGVGGPADAAHATRSIEVSTHDTMAYEPAAIKVAAGETITFVVTNVGQSTHEFTIGNAAMQQEHADAMAHMPAGMAHDLPNSITLQPGETKELTWQFGHAGPLEYGCHEHGHYDAGMHGQISVS